MKISLEEKERLENLYQTFLNDPKIQRMKEIPMHRGSNCYEHSFKVAKKAVHYALRFPSKKLSIDTIMLGAILHDYYLYDWRKDRSKRKRHAVDHEFIASENASKDFGISPEVKRIIESHMWPINFKKYPKGRAAKIVSLCDKAVTIGEVFSSKKHKANKRNKYLERISHLF